MAETLGLEGRSADEVLSEGRLVLALLDDSSWIARRVETISFPDLSTVERRVTVDIVDDELLRLAREAGRPDRREVQVPLALLEKRLLLDVDLRDAVGTALPIATSGDDSRLAQAALLALVRPDPAGLDALSRVLVGHIGRIVAQFPSESDRASLVGGIAIDPYEPVWTLWKRLVWIARSVALRIATHDWPATGSGREAWLKSLDDLVLGGVNDESAEGATDIVYVEGWRLPDSAEPTESDVTEWDSLIRGEGGFTDLLATFTLRYMLTATVAPRPGQTTIVKYRYVETITDPTKWALGERLALSPYRATLDAPYVGMATRDHLHLVLPDGVVFNRAALWLDEGQLEPGERTIEDIDEYERRVARNRAAIYTRNLNPGPYYLYFSVRPDIRGFLRLSRLSVLVSFLILLGGGLAQYVGQRLAPSGDESTAEAAIALLLLVPSLISGYLARENEHELLSEILRWPRSLVAGTALTALVAGGALVLHTTGDALAWVWFGCSGFCLLVATLLSRIIRTSKRHARWVDERAGMTVTGTVRRLSISDS